MVRKKRLKKGTVLYSGTGLHMHTYVLRGYEKASVAGVRIDFAVLAQINYIKRRSIKTKTLADALDNYTIETDVTRANRVRELDEQWSMLESL